MGERGQEDLRQDQRAYQRCHSHSLPGLRETGTAKTRLERLLVSPHHRRTPPRLQSPRGHGLHRFLQIPLLKGLPPCRSHLVREVIVPNTPSQRRRFRPPALCLDRRHSRARLVRALLTRSPAGPHPQDARGRKRLRVGRMAFGRLARPSAIAALPITALLSEVPLPALPSARPRARRPLR